MVVADPPELYLLSIADHALDLLGGVDVQRQLARAGFYLQIECTVAELARHDHGLVVVHHRVGGVAVLPSLPL